jgi:hypothetical protein
MTRRWVATITQRGRWTYFITYHSGLIESYVGHFVWGRDRAEKKARRFIRKLNLQEVRRSENRTEVAE